LPSMAYVPNFLKRPEDNRAGVSAVSPVFAPFRELSK
jgi:hypothetical protein